jgi:hypothetical protein
MDIVKVHKEGIICSICFKEIAINEEVLKFWNKVTNPKKEFRIGHSPVSNGKTITGEIHFRHMLCQYNSARRNRPFEEWLADIKKQAEFKKAWKEVEKVRLKNE